MENRVEPRKSKSREDEQHERETYLQEVADGAHGNGYLSRNSAHALLARLRLGDIGNGPG